MKIAKWLLAAAASAALAACQGGEAGSNEAADANASGTEQASGTLADGLKGETRFLAAAQAAGLDRTLSGPGPYTVIVPVDAAFAKLPAGTLEGLMREDSRPQLTGVLTYHILPGEILAADIGKAIDNGQGKAVLATMGGGTLTATREGDRIILADAAGGRATVTQADDRKSNGIIHRVDGVLMPGNSAEGA